MGVHPPAKKDAKSHTSHASQKSSKSLKRHTSLTSHKKPTRTETTYRSPFFSVRAADAARADAAAARAARPVLYIT
eukprot:1171767-Prymnesium_polylepis.1